VYLKLATQLAKNDRKERNRVMINNHYTSLLDKATTIDKALKIPKISTLKSTTKELQLHMAVEN
jgi:hypothetical protein